MVKESKMTEKPLADILIVDDTQDTLQLLAKILKEKEFNVRPANNGQLALRSVEARHPDLILLDIKMPGMDGFEVCRQLKASESTQMIPVIFISALNETVDKVEGFKAGGIDYISKPFETEEVLARVKIHLNLRSLQTELEKANEEMEDRVHQRTEELATANIALKESEEKFKNIFEEMKEGYIKADMDGNIILVNPSTVDLLGYSNDQDLIGNNVSDILYAHPNDRDYLKKNIKGPGTVENFEVEYRKRDGEILIADCNERLIVDDNNNPIALEGLFRDITIRKKAERDMIHLGNLLQNIINSMPSCIIAIDEHSQVIQWNQEAANISGIELTEALGKNVIDLLPLLKAEKKTLSQVLSKNKAIKDEKVTLFIGSEKHLMDITVYPIERDGSPGAVIRIDDVTQRVQVEELMIQSEKMLSVGGLAAGMAHEINNPLAAMMQSTQVILNHIDPDLAKNSEAAKECGATIEIIDAFMKQRDIPEMLEAIHQSGTRAAAIVQNMLNFSRKSESANMLHNLAQLLDNTIELASNDYDLKKKYDFKSIKIYKDYAPNTPFVPCEGNEIQQVILNLLKNASEAISDKSENNKKPTITLRLKKSGTMAQIEIEDNGPGMDESTRKRIFEPFFTTKPVGEGTGLGLSVSYFIITDKHKGTMSVESIPGKGSTFIIKLPIK